MSTAEIAYGIIAALAPLTGDRAAGSITVRAGGPDAPVPIHSFGIPIRVSEAGTEFLDWKFPIRTVQARTATAAGVAVSCVANVGGAKTNLAAGTRVRWFPSITGIEESSVVAAGGMVGGTEPLADGALRSLVWYQDIPSSGPIAEDLIRAAVAKTPGAILYWGGSAGDDVAGNGRAVRKDRWGVIVVVDNVQSFEARAQLGLSLIDLVASLLVDRSGVLVPGLGSEPHHAMVVSSPGIKISGRRQRQTFGNLYAFEVTFETHTGYAGIDGGATEAVVNDWLRTRYDLPTATDETGSHPSTLAVVEGATYPAP